MCPVSAFLQCGIRSAASRRGVRRVWWGTDATPRRRRADRSTANRGVPPEHRATARVLSGTRASEGDRRVRVRGAGSRAGGQGARRAVFGGGAQVIIFKSPEEIEK